MKRLLVAILGGSLLLAYVLRHPVLAAPGPPPGPLSLPDVGRLLSLLHAVGGLALLNLTAYVLGAALHSRLFRSFRAEALTVPLRLGLGLLVVADAVLVLAAVHLLRPWALVTVLAGPALIGTLSRVRGGGWDTTAIRSWRLPIGRVLAVGLLLAPPFLAVFGPRYGWDALTYHLAIPERYLFVDGIWVTPFSPYTAFPLNTEMLYGLALGTVGPALAKLIHFEFGCLVLWTLSALGGTFSRRGAWLAPLFLVSDPLFVWELSVAYADLPLAFYALLALAVAERWWSTGNRQALVPAGLLVGACLATRYPGLAVLAALGGAILLTPGVRTWRERASAGLLVTALAVAVVSPWLVRNLAFTGDPVAPALQGLFHPRGGEYFDPVAVEQQVAFSRSIGMGRSLGALLAAPWRLTMHPSPGLYTGGFGFRIGPLSLLCLLLVLLVGDRPPLVRLSLATSALLYVAWFATSQEARFLLPVLVLLALCGSWALDRMLPSSARHPMTALWALPLLAVLLCEWPLWAGVGRDYAEALVWSAAQRERVEGPAQELADRLRRELRPPARILLLFESRGYLFRGLSYVPYHIHEASPALQLVHRSRSPEQLRSRLEALGVTHLVVNSSMRQRFRPVWVDAYGPDDFRSDLELLASFWRECTRPVLIGEGVAAARLLPSCRAGADRTRGVDRTQ